MSLQPPPPGWQPPAVQHPQQAAYSHDTPPPGYGQNAPPAGHGQQQPPGYGPGPQAPWAYGSIEPPSAWPVAVFTLLFGALGAISAARRANRARQVGVGGGRYWGTFGAVLAGNLVVFFAALAVAIPVFLNVRESALTKDLESRIVQDSATAGDNGEPAVKSADCDHVSDRADGSSAYTCRIGFDDGSNQSFTVVVDANRQWSVQQ